MLPAGIINRKISWQIRIPHLKNNTILTLSEVIGGGE